MWLKNKLLKIFSGSAALLLLIKGILPNHHNPRNSIKIPQTKIVAPAMAWINLSTLREEGRNLKPYNDKATILIMVKIVTRLKVTLTKIISDKFPFAAG
jgi:hypothetical protein